MVTVRLRLKATERTPNWIKGHSIDLINTNSTLESTLRPDIFIPNTKPLNDWINLAKTAIHRTVRQFQWDHPINHSIGGVSGKKLFATYGSAALMSAWVWRIYLLKPHPLTHPSICHSPSLSTPQEQGWTLELERERIGGEIGEKGKKEGGSTSTTPWMPSTSSILFMTSLREVALISWFFLLRAKLWFLVKGCRMSC